MKPIETNVNVNSTKSTNYAPQYLRPRRGNESKKSIIIHGSAPLHCD